MRNRSLTRQEEIRRALVAFMAYLSVLLAGSVHAAADTAAVSTINHAFATELGTGVYDMGGQSIFVIRLAPEREIRAADGSRPGMRLVMPIAAGTFGFNPFEGINPEVPERIDSLSVMPGIEFDFPQGDGWLLTPWVRVGGSFSEGESDGFLYGVGARMTWQGERGGMDVTRLHEASLVNIDYRASITDDRFLRLRNAVDLRRTTVVLTRSHRLLAGFYAIADIVPEPPDIPLEAGEQSMVQLELGVTFNAEPRPRIWKWQLPRLGFGYRVAGDFSGWRIVVGAPF
jgi:hypothetical protein